MRKIHKIESDVPSGDYTLIESDITTFKPKNEYAIVLAHLLLGEAGKFGSNSFEAVLDSLFSIKTKFLLIADIFHDPDVDYERIIENAAKGWAVEKEVRVDKYFGLYLERI